VVVKWQEGVVLAIWLFAAEGMRMIATSSPTKPQTSREAITLQLIELFRMYGFEGVSIADISAKTGLGRSSLYHYFSGGKQEMAQSVLDLVRVSLSEAVFLPLAERHPLATRIDRMFLAVDQIYAGGLLPCVLSSLLTTPSADPIASRAADFIAEWTSTLADALSSGGMSKPQERARHTMSLIQGSLVTARALDDKDVFAAALRHSRRVLLDPDWE
jgi:TetR/AcrR family transcriptional regulator, lmrAB and yxaGH operons repressor